MGFRNFCFPLALGALIVSSGCVVSDSKDAAAATDSASVSTAVPAPSTTTAMPPAAMPMDSIVPASADSSQMMDSSGIRLEVDLNARKVRIYKGQESVAAYPVAVGSKQWPTQTAVASQSLNVSIIARTSPSG